MYIFFSPPHSFKFHPFPFATFQLQRGQNIVKPSLSTRIADTSVHLSPTVVPSLSLSSDSSSSILCLSIREFILTIWERHRLIWISDFHPLSLSFARSLSRSLSLYLSNARARNVWSVGTTLVTNVIFGACSVPRI